MSELMDVQDCFSVIFHNVKEYYPPDSIINCQFSVKENTAIDEPANCYVGIFVVAWDSLDNAIAQQSFTSVELISSGGIYDLNFDPKEILISNFEEDEFYQFCFYNIVTKDVFGASCPFQVCNLREGSLVHIEELNFSSEDMVMDEVSWMLKESYKPVDEDCVDEDEDTVLIHNKTTLMENALANAAKEREEVHHLKQLNHSLTERDLLLKQSLLESQSAVKEMENFAAENTKKTEILLKNLTIEKESLTKALADKEAESLEHINKMKTELNAKIEAAEIRCDDLNKSLIEEKAGVEKIQLEYEENILNLKKEIELLGIKETESVNESSKSMEELKKKLNFEIAQKYEYMSEIEKLIQDVKRLNEEIKVRDSLVSTEREKLATLALQQEEMTSRLSSENKKICAEIQNLKEGEKSLVEAHQKELTCHRNRIDEMESIFKEEKSKLKNEIEQLNNELNVKINCISLLEANAMGMDENVLHMDILKKENMELTDTVDELKTKLAHLVQENLHLSDESKRYSPFTNSETGSMHALHVAYAHMQKQVTNLKKEKELHCQHNFDENTTDLERENEEFRLRLCMGRKAFDKQYLECQKLRTQLNKLKMSVSCISAKGDLSTQDSDMGEEYHTLLVEYNDLKGTHNKRVDELLNELTASNEQKEATEKELVKVTEEKNNTFKLNEELRVKLVQLVDHYEEKINNLYQEIGMLKIERNAALIKDKNSNVDVKPSSPDIVQTVVSVTCEQPNLIQMNRDVIPKTERKNKEDFTADPRNTNKVVSRQPDISNSAGVTRTTSNTAVVVKKQPALMTKIMYPPSMMQGHTYPNQPQEIPRQPRSEVATPAPVNEPLISLEAPPSQVIPNRTSVTEQPPSNGRGRVESPAPIYLDPPQECPICTLDFPANLTESAKTEHVNSHFDH